MSKGLVEEPSTVKCFYKGFNSLIAHLTDLTGVVNNSRTVKVLEIFSEIITGLEIIGGENWNFEVDREVDYNLDCFPSYSPFNIR